MKTQRVMLPKHKRSNYNRSLKPLFLLLFLMLCFTSCNKGHEEHSTAESEGLITELKVQSSDTIMASYEHPFAKGGDTVYTAPASVLTMQNGKTYVMKFSVDASQMDFTKGIFDRINDNQWPTAVSIEMEAPGSYNNVINTMSNGSGSINGYCSFTYAFDGMSAISSSELPITIWFWEIPKEDYHEDDGKIGVLHFNVFDCHSHWGIASGFCHCKTATCCPAGEDCYCDAPAKKKRCNGAPLCFCG